MSCAIVTRYLGPTNYRGARIVADAGMKRRVTIGYPHEYSGAETHFQAARALCAKFGWHGELVAGGLEDGNYVFVFSAHKSEDSDLMHKTGDTFTV